MPFSGRVPRRPTACRPPRSFRCSDKARRRSFPADVPPGPPHRVQLFRARRHLSANSGSCRSRDQMRCAAARPRAPRRDWTPVAWLWYLRSPVVFRPRSRPRGSCSAPAVVRLVLIGHLPAQVIAVVSHLVVEYRLRWSLRIHSSPQRSSDVGHAVGLPCPCWSTRSSACRARVRTPAASARRRAGRHQILELIAGVVPAAARRRTCPAQGRRRCVRRADDRHNSGSGYIRIAAA